MGHRLPSGLDDAAKSVPAWAKSAVWYQIFPERFRNGDPKNDPTRASLDRAAYQAVVDATCATWSAQQRKATPPDSGLEIQRLVQDFAVELQKLDEGLRLLSTYLLRIREAEPPIFRESSS